MNDVVISTERTPSVIALEIRALHSQAQRMVLSFIIEIGRRLKEAKALIPHGEWGNWLEENVSYSQSTANYYMQIFEEFGSDQIGLFGEAKSQALGNLSYTKALKLLAVPAEEREEFVETHDVENLSTRELDKLIRERDEARRRAQEAENEAESLKREKDASSALVRELQEKLDQARIDIKESTAEAEAFEKELEELKSRPIDVAVQEPDPAVIAKAKEEAAAEARKKAEDELRKKIEAAEKKAAEAEETAKDIKKEMEKLASQTSAEKDEALKRAEAAEKKLALAVPEIAQFKALYDETQALLNKLVGLIGAAPEDKREGLRRAMAALFDNFSAQVKAGAA